MAIAYRKLAVESMFSCCSHKRETQLLLLLAMLCNGVADALKYSFNTQILKILIHYAEFGRSTSQGAGMIRRVPQNRSPLWHHPYTTTACRLTSYKHAPPQMGYRAESDRC